jgi:hypothetical protein
MACGRIVAFFSVCIVWSLIGSESMAQSNKSEERPKAPYKLLYNNDTTNTASCKSPYHKKGEPFTEAKLVASIEEVAGKGVDAYLLSPGMGWVPWWPSKVEPDYYEWWKKRTGLEVIGARSGSGYEKYAYDGGDMVQVLIDTCRKLKMAPFVSLRLNDVHAQEDYVEKNQRSLNSSRFYVENPQWHLDPEHYKIKGYYGKRGMDWAVPEVREEKLKLLRELAENYDLAGLELDFLRHSQFFRDNGPPAEKRIEIMTAFVSEVRKALDKKEGQRRWLGVRIPLTQSAHPALGLDVKKLYDAGVDMFNLSCWYDTTQITDTPSVRNLVPNAAIYVEMTHTTGMNPHFHENKQGYGTIEKPRTSDEQFYTTARLAYARGADGMSLFNFVYYRMDRPPIVAYEEPPFHVLPKLVDRDFLAKQPPYYYLAGASYSRELPRTFNNGQSWRFQLDMLPTGENTTLRLRIHATKPIGDSRFTAKMNKAELMPTEDVSAFYDNPYDRMITPDAKHRLAWVLPANVVRDGLNKIELTLESGGPVTLFWMDTGI